MASDRMRRVDEAMREVLSAAITTEIKDPRVRTVLNTDDIMGGATTFTITVDKSSRSARSLKGTTATLTFSGKVSVSANDPTQRVSAQGDVVNITGVASNIVHVGSGVH